MASTEMPAGRGRGSIQVRPDGSLRVRVYTGYDQVTGKRHYVSETVRPGRRARAEAERVRIRLLSQIDERRNRGTTATVNQLLDRYLEALHVESSTRSADEGCIRRYIRPVLADLQVGRVDAEMLDTFYGQLGRCRVRCRRSGGSGSTIAPGQRMSATSRCRPHVCRPLAASMVRQIHWILSGAFDRAVRWRWIFCQSGPGRRSVASTEAGAAGAVAGRRGADRDGGVEGSCLGGARVARHDDRGAVFIGTGAATDRPVGRVDPLRRERRHP